MMLQKSIWVFNYGYVIKHSHFTDERKDYLLLIDESTLQKDASVSRVGD